MAEDVAFDILPKRVRRGRAEGGRASGSGPAPPRRADRSGTTVGTLSSEISPKRKCLENPSSPNSGAPAREGDGPPPGIQFEYLDHPADVQLHSWGRGVEEAFEQAALAMFNYMTPLKGIEVDESLTRQVEAEGHDLQSLLYAFLDELLFVFSTDLLVFKEVKIQELDREAWRIKATGKGETFDQSRHKSGTEVKAITYSAMKITEEEGRAEVFVIVDI